MAAAALLHTPHCRWSTPRCSRHAALYTARQNPASTQQQGCQARERVIVKDAFAAGAAGPLRDAAPRHAVLHDFCMMIPYGLVVVLAGIALGIRGPPAAGIMLSLSGLGILVCSKASLSSWKEGSRNTLATSTAVFISTYLTWLWGLKVKMISVKSATIAAVVLTPPAALFMLSGCMTLFLLYNISAGGNAPKVGAH